METTSAIWDLKPGDSITRIELERRFGTSRQGGVAPSVPNKLVAIFPDPTTGAKSGYHDDWHSDGCFHYTGRGQRGDQSIASFNGSILKHKEKQRALQLFNGSAGTVQYIGHFEIDDALPLYWMDARDLDGQIRKVVVFRLRPINVSVPDGSSPSPLEQESEVSEVPVEAQYSELHAVMPNGEPYTAERRESTLVQEFKTFLESRNLTATRYKIKPVGEPRAIFSDIFIASKNLLIEAKGTVERGAIRTALGQLADYRRFLKSPKCGMLLPSRPSDDLMALLSLERVSVIYQTDAGFDGLDSIIALPEVS